MKEAKHIFLTILFFYTGNLLFLMPVTATPNPTLTPTKLWDTDMKISRNLTETPIWKQKRPEISRKVVNGENVPGVGEIPYQVSLQYWNSALSKWRHSCGGSILSSTTILTAAHCFDQNPIFSNFRIVAGTTKLNSLDDTAQTRPILKGVLHPLYKDGFEHDLAVLKVDELILNRAVSSIRIPSGHLAALTGLTATVSGWGRTKTDGSVPNFLKKGSLKILSRKTCQATFSRGFNEAIICGNSTQSVCEGDSGGPWAILNALYNSTRANLLIGVVTFGLTTCEQSVSGFIYVGGYYDWIQNASRQLNSPNQDPITLVARRTRSCTEDEFSCPNGTCIPSLWRCDGDDDCDGGFDEDDCKKPESHCGENEFTCSDGKCIKDSYKCDGDDDCEDGSDETDCDTPLTPCASNQFRCPDGRCGNNAFRCDRDNDCGDNFDEEDCDFSWNLELYQHKNFGGAKLQLTWANDSCINIPGPKIGSRRKLLGMDNRLNDRSSSFKTTNYCVRLFSDKNCHGSFADVGAGVASTCNRRDLSSCGYDNVISSVSRCSVRCPVDMFGCRNDHCIPLLHHCDGDDDCGDLSDEMGCKSDKDSWYATLFDHTGFNGRMLNVMGKKWSCVNLRDKEGCFVSVKGEKSFCTPFDNKAVSINTWDTCVRVYNSADCHGHFEEIGQDGADGEERCQPGDLKSSCNFGNKISSVSSCTYVV